MSNLIIIKLRLKIISLLVGIIKHHYGNILLNGDINTLELCNVTLLHNIAFNSDLIYFILKTIKSIIYIKSTYLY